MYLRRKIHRACKIVINQRTVKASRAQLADWTIALSKDLESDKTFPLMKTFFHSQRWFCPKPSNVIVTTPQNLSTF